MGAQIRKLWTQVEEIRLAAGRGDADGPLRKVAAGAVVVNPLAGDGDAPWRPAAVASRGRLNARLGGKTVADVLGSAGSS